MSAPDRSAATLPRLRWHRFKQGWRCVVGIHRWRGHADLGDGVNVAPISGYRRPNHIGQWRVCDWCGKHQIGVLTSKGWCWRGR